MNVITSLYIVSVLFNVFFLYRMYSHDAKEYGNTLWEEVKQGWNHNLHYRSPFIFLIALIAVHFFMLLVPFASPTMYWINYERKS